MRLIALSCVILCATSSFAFAQSEPASDGDPRNEERTLATLPEWYIVYSAEEYADFVEGGGSPSEFPYFGAIRQYWQTLDHMHTHVDGEIDEETETVLNVIGLSFTFEYALIGAYEKTIGRITESWQGPVKSSADLYADRVAREYADFLYQTPWYKFPYFSRLAALWRESALYATTPRGYERLSAFSLGYGMKGMYGALLGYLTRSTFGYVGTETRVIMKGPGGTEERMLPRYRAFRDEAVSLARMGYAFESIEGNARILVTARAAQTDTCVEILAPQIDMPILTRPGESRYGFIVDVAELHTLITSLDACGIPLEHIYDY